MKTTMHTDFSNIMQQFAGLEDLAIEAAAEALEESAEIVAQKAKRAMASSRFDFDRPPEEVKKALITKPKADKAGTTVEVEAGFDFSGKITGHVGFPSIFLMHGTPEIEPDKEMYDAFFSARTRKEISEKQMETFNRKIMEGK